MAGQNQARFGLKVLPLSLSDQAVNGEIILDPNTGHLYVKNNGKLISKTVELENRLNKLVSDLKFRTTSLSFNGSDMSNFVTDKTKISFPTTSNNAAIQAGRTSVALDEPTAMFDINHNFKYRVTIQYRRSGTNYDGPDIGVKCDYTYNKTKHGTVEGKLVSNSKSSSSYDLTFPSTAMGGVGYFTLTNTENTIIYSISIVKAHGTAIAGSPLTLLPYDVTDQSKVQIHNFTSTSSNNVINSIAYVNINKDNGSSYFNLWSMGLIPGMYSLNLNFLSDSNGVLSISNRGGDDTYHNQKINLDKLSYSEDGTTVNNTIKTAACTITIPLCGPKFISLACTGQCKLLNMSLSLIHSSIWNCRE